MPNLKDLKIRISSVKSTQKITSAMKMVAAAKLRRAQENAEAARPYSARMERMIGSLSNALAGIAGAPPLLAGRGGDEQTHLIVPLSADRGLCGAFNGSIIRETRKMIADLEGQGKTVKLFCVGRKGYDALKREFASSIVDHVQDIGRKSISFSEADELGVKIASMFDAEQFDACTIIFNRFKSAMTQIVSRQQIIPFVAAPDKDDGKDTDNEHKAAFIFEPDEEEILAELLPRNIAVQMFQALLENTASEHGSRMTAMDNATRNAGDMIDDLTLTYNRTRQAFITKELIEIISGAEAL